MRPGRAGMMACSRDASWCALEMTATANTGLRISPRTAYLNTRAK
jgi:hypothetical protein